MSSEVATPFQMRRGYIQKVCFSPLRYAAVRPARLPHVSLPDRLAKTSSTIFFIVSHIDRFIVVLLYIKWNHTFLTSEDIREQKYTVSFCLSQIRNTKKMIQSQNRNGETTHTSCIWCRCILCRDIWCRCICGAPICDIGGL